MIDQNIIRGAAAPNLFILPLYLKRSHLTIENCANFLSSSADILRFGGEVLIAAGIIESIRGRVVSGQQAEQIKLTGAKTTIIGVFVLGVSSMCMNASTVLISSMI